MTHYNENPGMVRVDYFRPSGKWYMTEAVNMDYVWDEMDIHKAIEKAMDNHWNVTRPGRAGRWRQFTIVVLEPYHKNAYPIMLVSKES